MKPARAAVLAVAVAVPAATQQPQKHDPAEAAAGQIIYVRYCGACHGKTGRGDGPIAADLVQKPTDLTALASASGGRFPFDKVAQSIDGRRSTRAHGTPDMPVWGEVFPKTAGTESPTVEGAVKRITHYIWSIQKK